MDFNKELGDLYLSKWSELTAAMKPIMENDAYAIKPTNPLLIYPCDDGECVRNEKYANADIRVMIFGQDQNDWEGVFGRDVEHLLGVYDDFFNGDFNQGANGRYHSPFANGFRHFEDMLNAKYPNKKISYVWNNIIKIGKARTDTNENAIGLPPDYILDVERKHFSVVQDELNILKPDVVLFLTGPNYDNHIEENFGKLNFESLYPEMYESRNLAKVMLPGVKLAYRTYHPGHLNRIKETDLYYQPIIDDINL